MYKPNGEEPMTKQEEARRRAALAERIRGEQKPEGVRSALYAALFGASPREEEGAVISFNQAQ